MSNKSVFKYDIAILRLLAIGVVVFFHAYGMTYANHLPEAIALMYRDKYEWFNQSYPINIAMPMFVVISGYLFGSRVYRNKFSSFWQMAWNKFKRVMIPYFLFTTIFMFATNAVNWSALYIGHYWHLWFLPMLFWCFIVSYLLRKVIGGVN